MKKKKYRVEIPTLEYFQKNFNCMNACPVNTQAGRYVAAIAGGDFEAAYSIARQPNPMVYVCARVCAHPCETQCRRGVFDEPVAIRALKRAATDRHNLGMGHLPSPPSMARTRKTQKVAIVGAGPAGLSAANDLALRGYKVNLFEAQPVAGGMLYLGLPVYRLPRDIIKLEIDSILNLGVELHTNCAIGRDCELSHLRDEYQALFFAIGAHKSRDLRIPGVELDGVLRGVDFLLNANLGYKMDLGKKVLVIGGGNVAVDVARSVLRHTEDIEGLSPQEMRKALIEARSALSDVVGHLKEEHPDAFTMAMDVARSALRVGAREVHMVCLESFAEMPAHRWEIEESLAEGIQIHPSLGPQEIVGQDGKVIGLKTIVCSSVFDKDGRFNPSFVPDSEAFMEADTVIMAIGQASDLSLIGAEDGIRISPRGLIEVEPATLATSAPGIFAGGDVAFGPRLIVDAVADGQKAARSIEAFLESGGRASQRKTIGRFYPIKDHKMVPDYDRIPRQLMPTLPLERRIGIAEVELGYSNEAALKEAQRCLRCYIYTIFDSDKCILCGGCVDVCPYHCLKLVPIDKLMGEEALSRLVECRYRNGNEKGADRNRLIGGFSAQPVAIIKDEEKCIRCGLCARRCPTKAITMEALELEEVSVSESG